MFDESEMVNKSLSEVSSPKLKVSFLSSIESVVLAVGSSSIEMESFSVKELAEPEMFPETLEPETD